MVFLWLIIWVSTSKEISVEWYQTKALMGQSTTTTWFSLIVSGAVMSFSKGYRWTTDPHWRQPKPGPGFDGPQCRPVLTRLAGIGEVWCPLPRLCASGEWDLLLRGKTLLGAHPGSATLLHPAQAAPGDDGADLEHSVRCLLAGVEATSTQGSFCYPRLV